MSTTHLARATLEALASDNPHSQLSSRDIRAARLHVSGCRRCASELAAIEEVTAPAFSMHESVVHELAYRGGAR